MHAQKKFEKTLNFHLQLILDSRQKEVKVQAELQEAYVSIESLQHTANLQSQESFCLFILFCFCFVIDI